MRKRFPGYMERYGLKEYKSPRAPAVFFGCYKRDHLDRLRRHRGLAVLVWLGTDIVVKGGHQFFRNQPARLRHLAIGPWIERDLRALGLPYRRFNLLGSPIIDELGPEPKGDAVYCYLPHGKGEKYGAKQIGEVRALLPGVRFLVHDGNSLPHREVPSLYRQCFIGLRLTDHDGCAETVTELGLMGRRCIHNGDHPSAIPWRGAEDIAEAVIAERATIGSTDEMVAATTRSFIETGRDWLEVSRWKPKGRGRRETAGEGTGLLRRGAKAA